MASEQAGMREEQLAPPTGPGTAAMAEAGAAGMTAGGAAGMVIGVAIGWIVGFLIGILLGDAIGQGRGFYQGVQPSPRFRFAGRRRRG